MAATTTDAQMTDCISNMIMIVIIVFNFVHCLNITFLVVFFNNLCIGLHASKELTL